MKLYELNKSSKVNIWDDVILEFLWIDWMYWKWKHKDEFVIMYSADQDVYMKDDWYFIY